MPPCHEGGSCRNFIIASGRGCGNEAVSLSRRRLDVARSPPAVLELDAKISDVAVDEVASREVIRSPQPVEDLLARERDPRIRRQEIQQGPLDRRQTERDRTGAKARIP